MSKNTRRVHVHALEHARLGDGIERALDQRVFDALSKRAVLLARSGDLVVVDVLPDERWLDLLSTIGIEGFEIVTPEHGGGDFSERLRADHAMIQRLAGMDCVVEPYMGTESMHELAARIGAPIHAPSAALVDRLNKKSSLNEILERSGIPTLETIIAARDETVGAAIRASEQWGGAIVRADVSIGGYGVWTLRPNGSTESLAQGIARSDPSRLFVIQPIESVVCSPNVQYRIDRDSAELIGLSDQRFDESFAFGGNSSPTRSTHSADMIEQSERIAHVLADQGYKGLVGIDFIESESGSVFAIEINPRVNTSTFALALMERTKTSAFELITRVECADPFETLNDLLYDTNMGEGIVPITLPIPNRPVMDLVALSPSSSRCAEIVERLTSTLEREHEPCSRL